MAHTRNHTQMDTQRHKDMHMQYSYEWHPHRVVVKRRTTNAISLYTDTPFSSQAWNLFFVLLSPSDPCGGWKWRIKTRAWENKPSCNQVGEHCSPSITTLLDKSLFSLHTVSTWCYHFSLNSIKSALSAQMKNGTVLRWAHSFVQVSHMRPPSAIWPAEMLRVYCCEKPSWTQIIIKPWALFWFPLKKNRQLCAEKRRQNFSFG